MSFLKTLSTMVLAIVFSLNAQSLKISDGKSNIDLLSQNANGYQLKYSIGKIKYFNVETKAGEFTEVTIPGNYHSHNIGEPNLPTMNKIIEIPVGADVEARIISYDEKIIDLNQKGIVNPLMPTQPSLSKSENADAVPFEFNREVYSEDKFYSLKTAETKILGIMRYRRLALVQIAPVEYNPVKNILRVKYNIVVSVNFKNADLAATENLREKYYSPFFETNFDNILKLDTKDDPQSLIRFPQKYVIVVPNDFIPTMQPFIDWKTQQGFNVILKTFDGSIGNSELKNYLHDLYNNATEDDPAPTYVLFVGDTQQIPPFSGTTGGHVTDLPFVDVTGDFLPDMYPARFSARTVDELQPQVDKTLYYEKYQIADPSYLDNITLIAGWDASHASTYGYPTIRYGQVYYYNATNGFNTNMYETTGSGQFETEITNDINNGVAFINYTAHGSQTSWADPNFTVSDVHNFTNDGKYTLAIGNACLTGAFDTGECFGEAWLRKANAGAIGYIGGTNSTYWDEDVWWSTGYFDHVGDGVTPTFEETSMGAYDAANITDDLTTQSAMVYVGNFAVTTANSSRSHYYWEIYQLFGDPSLMVYWGTPDQMTVNHLPVIILGSSSYDVDVPGVPMALLGLTKDGALIASAMTDENGHATFNFSEPISEAGAYTLTITALNKIPYVEEIQAIVPANVTLTPNSAAIQTATQIAVNVTDTANAPIFGVKVWASAPGYFVDTVLTDNNGTANLTIESPVGPFIMIMGKRAADSYLLFSDTLAITGGTDFTNPQLTVETTYGLVDTFSVGLTGTIKGSGTKDGVVVYTAGEDGVFNSDLADTMSVTPATTDPVIAFLVQPGYNTYVRTFPVIKATGSVEGYIRDAQGNGILDAVVSCQQNHEEIFSVNTSSSGHFIAPKPVNLGNATFLVRAFGYESSSFDYFVNYPSNIVEDTLQSAPSSYIQGTVTNEQGESLEATVKLYRFDTGELYKTLYTSSSEPGVFGDTIVNFDYEVKVKSSGYKMLDTLITVSGNETWDFSLELPSGILILAADSKGYFADKERTIPIKNINGIKLTSTEIADTLNSWNMSCTVETPSSTDPTTWPNYSAIFYLQGSSQSSIDENLQTKIIDYVNNDGKMLIEGGELGYANRSEPIDSAVLHVTGWSADNSGNIKNKDVRSPLWHSPNHLPLTIDHTYSDWGDEDAMEPADSNEVIAVWTNYGDKSSIIAYNGQVVYLSFNYANISDGTIKGKLLKNICKYLDLLTPVSVNDDNGLNPVPDKFILAQNYPNPFNPTSTIKFALPVNSNVTLDVYNVLGQRVSQLVNGKLTAGYHSVKWDAGVFASGVYIYKLTAKNNKGNQIFSSTRKMVLLK